MKAAFFVALLCILPYSASAENIVTMNDCEAIGALTQKLAGLSQAIDNVEVGHISQGRLDSEWAAGSMMDTRTSVLLAQMNGLLAAASIAANVIAPVDQSIANATLWKEADGVLEMTASLKDNADKMSGTASNPVLLEELKQLVVVQKSLEEELQILKNKTAPSFALWNQRPIPDDLRRIIVSTKTATTSLKMPD